MVRSSLHVRAIGAALGVATCLAVASAPTPATATPATSTATAATVQPSTAAEPEPLTVTLDDISPAVVPRRGPIEITGTVTNSDTETWSTINLYPFVGEEPLTTPAQLEAATEVPTSEEVGQRLTDRGPYDSVPELAPGESYRFTISLPRNDYRLPSRGVYWFGVHALGEGPQTRDLIAEGRARTFLTFVPRNAKGSVDTAVVVPLRRLVSYAADGSLAQVDAWVRTLEDGGRLHGLVKLGAAAGPAPVTWLVDPALLDAVRRLSLGNPPRSLAPTQPPGEAVEPEDGESPTPTETIGPEQEQPADEEQELTPELAEAAQVASDWLEDLREALAGDQVLTLPYGDVDVSAAADYDPELVELAARRTGAVLASWDVTTSPAFGSPGGYLDRAGIELADPATTVLVTDRMFGADPPAVVTADQHRLVVTSSGAAAGGPLPGPRLSALSLRQRLLAEAAVRLRPVASRPLVMMVPDQWSPDRTNRFFGALQDADWVDLADVGEIADGPAQTAELDELEYPDRQTARALGPSIFTAVRRLVEAGETLQNLLTRNDQVAGVVLDQALSGVSYSARLSPQAAQSSLTRSTRWIDTRLEAVEIDAPPGVTLSGGTGKLAATITNTLDEPVTVVVSATSDTGIVIRDSEPQQLGPRSRTTILLPVRTRRQGVHEVTLRALDADGHPLGSADSFPIRSAQVSTVIWVVMATGAGILFVAIAFRLVRRFRRRHDPEPEAPDTPHEAVTDAERVP
ncbi:DUF6049 family protein [Nocardioides sp. cx-169]|uniref:DUF6049 family protein n=1 Tax=Nocardioides sp. cx-169 TaxID=2899080 RepID=UPI001E4E2829|nr:DUF6049 family protein [Nocardioides sp. cx-169]MCD4533135.1 DUF6049 family protein [Nocardioides sp. cx-169]